MRALSLCLLLLFALPQCGGAGAGAEPKSAANHESDAESDGDSESSESEAKDDDAPAGRADATPRGPNCDDGSCSPCGGGICPSGWYCDENASGGAACSWLTECADKPTCGCITRVLGSACKCREEGGGLKVSCS
ncbi:MAG TPA: hypothetical protein VJN18_15270 [Polyangiaceae bacterium]|nr:hypothetical protein [Polyangiaceae bacterium]